MERIFEKDCCVHNNSRTSIKKFSTQIMSGLLQKIFYFFPHLHDEQQKKELNNNERETIL